MAEIIGPDGKKYFTQDHFAGEENKTASKKDFKIPKLDVKLDNITDYMYLIGGVLALLIGLWRLADIAIGIILVFLGTTGINYWMMRHK